MDERTEIRQFVEELLRKKGDKAPFSDCASLTLSGRLESIETVEIVMFLESRFGVDFSKIGFDQDDLDSIDLICDLVKSHARA